MSITENVTVTQNYNYGDAETRNTVAHTLSKEEIDYWWYYENGRDGPFWTSTLRSYQTAFCCNNDNDIDTYYGTYYISEMDGERNDNYHYVEKSGIYIYLGFKDPFSEGLIDNTNGTINSIKNYVLSYSSCVLDRRFTKASFDSTTKTLYITV